MGTQYVDDHRFLLYKGGAVTDITEAVDAPEARDELSALSVEVSFTAVRNNNRDKYMHWYGIEPGDKLRVVNHGREVFSGVMLMPVYMAKGLEFDAVMTSDDSLAVGTVKYAHASGISIPDELNIIGYNNSILSRCTDPEITSIDSKVEALCTTTINTLMGVFSGVNVPSRTTIASDLIKRKTTNF